MPDESLEVLEKHLRKIGSGELDPITGVIWQSLGETITKVAISYISRGHHILDVGCGSGGLIMILNGVFFID